MEKIDHHLGKLLPDDTEVVVNFIELNFEKKVEVNVSLRKRLMHAEAMNSENMHGAIDEVVDILKKQVRRYKNRLDKIYRKKVSFNDEVQYMLPSEEEELPNEEYVKIERIKKFAMKPMDPEEAAMEMELLNHTFYVFLNSETDEVNVIYKRKNGSYGLIEPKH